MLVRLLVFSTGVVRLFPAGVSCLVFLVLLCVFLLLLLRPRWLRWLRCDEERGDADEELMDDTSSSRVPASSSTGAAGRAFTCEDELSLGRWTVESGLDVSLKVVSVVRELSEAAILCNSSRAGLSVGVALSGPALRMLSVELVRLITCRYGLLVCTSMVLVCRSKSVVATPAGNSWLQRNSNNCAG